jgi:hypothetical protein
MPNLLEALGDAVATELTARPAVWASRPEARRGRLAVTWPRLVQGRARRECRDAFWDRHAQGTHGRSDDRRHYRRVFPQLKDGVVGLAGLEPAASSLSEMDGQAPC